MNWFRLSPSFPLCELSGQTCGRKKQSYNSTKPEGLQIDVPFIHLFSLSFKINTTFSELSHNSMAALWKLWCNLPFELIRALKHWLKLCSVPLRIGVVLFVPLVTDHSASADHAVGSWYGHPFRADPVETQLNFNINKANTHDTSGVKVTCSAGWQLDDRKCFFLYDNNTGGITKNILVRFFTSRCDVFWRSLVWYVPFLSSAEHERRHFKE